MTTPLDHDNEPTDVADNEPTDVADNEPTDVADSEPTDVTDNEPTDVTDNEPTDVTDNQTTGESEVTDDGASASPPSPQSPPPSSHKSKKQSEKARLRTELAQSQRRTSILKKSVVALAVAVVLLAVATTVLGVMTGQARSDLADSRQTAATHRADLEAAQKVVDDYAQRSLTINYRNAADYVQGLTRGTTPAFAKTFSTEEGGAGRLTQELLQQLQMVSEGTVVYTFLDGDPDAPPPDGQPWNFVVTATQTATTTQQPERTTSAVILRVVVVRSDGQWKVANFAPDPKLQSGNSSAIPGVN